MPPTLRSHAVAAKADRRDIIGSKFLSVSTPVKIPTDGYDWTKYGQIKVKSPEGTRSYFRCRYSACWAKKVELCDQFNSVIKVVCKGQHKHDPPKRVILNGGKVLSTEKSLKRKSISTRGLKEHDPVEVVHIDDSATVMAQAALNKSHGVKVRSYFTRLSAMAAIPTANAEVPDAGQKVTTGSESSCLSKPVKIPIDSYAWIKYGQKQVKSPEGSRGYFKCKYSACCAKKVESRDQFNSIINVVYKGQHKHNPPKRVILKEGNVLSTAKSLIRKSSSTHELNEIDDSATVIAKTALSKSRGVTVPSSFTRFAATTANANVAEAGQRVTTRSKSLCLSKPVKIPIDSYAWIKYGQKQVMSPECSRGYFKCKYSGCCAKKMESRVNSIINVVYKGQHKHNPPKRVILKEGNILSTAKLLTGKSISTHGLNEHMIEVEHIDDSATVIAKTALNKSPRVRVPSSLTRLPVMPATTTMNADVTEAGQKVTTESKSLCVSKSVKIPNDSYGWTKYGQTQVKSPEGSRSYFKCKYSNCLAKKVESCDQFNSIINVVYKGQHKHNPPKRVILKGGNVLSTEKSLKRKSISTHRLKEHPIEDVSIDDSEIEQRLKRNSSESSVLKQPKKPKFIVHAAAGMKVSGDGYKWRKYRQKMVKGNPHPRNCYKCTCAGCTVKKHIEKVDDGSSQVIITYKGLHNHDIPLPKKRRVPPSGLVINAASSPSKKRGYSSTLKQPRQISWLKPF